MKPSELGRPAAVGTGAQTGVEDFLGSLFPANHLSSFVDGGYAPRSGVEVAIVENPADGSAIADFDGADERCVDMAVLSARDAFSRGDWATMVPADRASLLYGLGSVLLERRDEIAKLESLDTGKPLSQARSDADAAIRYFRFYAGLADKLMGETIPMPSGQLAYTIREPYGVVAHVLPWNSPLSQFARGVAPSLACGNTVVVKPSSSAPLTSLYLADLLTQHGLPRGVVNVVLGPGATVGRLLAGHPQVGMVTFTGSVETGREILATTAKNIVPCNLELGGKSPAVVFPDADLSRVVASGLKALVRNAGQSCFAMSRFIVHHDVMSEYLDRISQAVDGLSIGPGLEDKDLGPLISEAQLEKVVDYVATGVAGGAKLATAGRRVTTAGLGSGYFLSPTVLAGVTSSMRVAQEEIFGPVQVVLGFDTEEEAIALANDSIYGLAASVFTGDFGTAHRVAAALQAGQVQINDAPIGGVETPFGGYKQSGIGREKGVEAVRHYTQVKTVIGSIARRL